MSREQWGHGYRSGLKDALEQSDEPKWLVKYNADGMIDCICYIHKYFKDHYLVEVLPYLDLLFILWFGLEVKMEMNPSKDVYEIGIDECENSKRFYSFEAVVGECYRVGVPGFVKN